MSIQNTKLVNQKEYLKKYLSGDKEKKKKKKDKKHKKSEQAKVKIIDDDSYNDNNVEIDEDLLFGGEDAPQIVGEYIEENGDEVRSKWRNIAVKDEPKTEPTVDSNGVAMHIKQEPADDDSNLWGRKVSTITIKQEPFSDDRRQVISPTVIKIKQEKRSNSRDQSPERTKVKNRHGSDQSSPRSRSISDQSPPRKRRNSNESSPRRRNRGADQSPPRNRRDSDQSPPRRRRDADPSPTRKRYDSDQSPPRRRQSPAGKSPRRKRRDSDQSPPRRRRDQTPPRRRLSSDQSPPRRRRDVDQSPPRKRGEANQSPPRRRQSPLRRQRNADQSSPRRRRSNSNDSKHLTRSRDQSPPRRLKKEEQLPHERKSRWAKTEVKRTPSPPPTHKPKTEGMRTLDGKKAGLQDAQSLKRETDERRRDEHRMFDQMSSDVSGRDAEVQMRSTGRRGRRARDAAAEDPVERQRKEAHEQKKKELYDRWGKGLKQLEDQQTRSAEMAHEAAKPVARYANDEDLDRHLREQEHPDDPMLAYIREKRKKREQQSDKPVMPEYEGSYPENRFGIRPGYRWDGVDRSNGYEQRWFDKQNERRALQDEAYKYSVEDM